LYNAMHLVETWPTKQVMTEMLRLRGENGRQLTWTHLAYLTNIKDEQVRTQMAATALEQGWTAKELYRNIQARLTNTATVKPRGPGRPYKVPSGISNCVTHVKTISEKFSDLVDKSWTGAAFSLSKAVEDMPPNLVNTQLVKQLHGGAEMLSKVIDRATKMLGVMQRSETLCVQRMEAQKNADAETEEEAEEPDDRGDNIVNMADWDRERHPKKKAKAAKKGRVGITR
jgi:hypothetical protein